MEQILKTVAISKMFSLLDGFSRYNQVYVKESDQHKTMFTIKWGTFIFVLSNASATFQWAMYIDFRGLINLVILIYLDDLMLFSKSKDDHFNHLEKVF